ncbi:polyketide synthase [Mesorhizobium sp. B2-4-13]|nr:polyketide synthase [Mesorhizobium sp. B2-4-13]
MSPKNSAGPGQEAMARRPAPIAIVGLSCRFPGSVGPDAYHRTLIEGRDLFSPPPRHRWPWCADDRIAVPKVGALADVLDFDNALFRVSPREAETIDPHQRVMLEEAWLAIGNAGYRLEDFRHKTTGVFVAVYNPDFQFYAREGDWDEISRMYLATGAAHTMVPNRISYVFDLKGPSEVVDTACSSALVAIHRAVEAIRSGECEQAIVGGVSLLLEPSRLVRLQELGLLSVTGESAPFDRESRGQMLGEGAAALVLKPLENALSDRDTIHAVIHGSGVNHQGAASGGLTRPSASAQAELIARTWVRHGLDPRDAGYVEAHGNGGGGDLSELLAFQDVFAEGLRIGSVKGNIGFLEAAGGLSQIIKVVMAMRHRIMPATRAHRHLVEDTALRPGAVDVLRDNTDIDDLSSGKPFLAGVHAYGLGGCNAHVVLGEAPPRSEDGHEHPLPFLLSGDDDAELAATADSLLQWLRRTPSASLPDISFTLAAGRPQQRRRAAFFCLSKEALAGRLGSLAHGLEQAQAEVATTVADDDLRRAMSRWLDGVDIAWEDLLLQGQRIELAPAPLRRRRFPLPAIAGVELVSEGRRASA